MSAKVVSFLGFAPRTRDWNNQELAEFYRVEASLMRSGLPVVTDRGLSDEGDPWFVFCHAETEDVIVHFARIDEQYVVASPAFNNCVRGRQFRPLIESLIENHPLVIARPKDGGKLFIHPAALLVALVSTCYFKLGQTDAVAAEAKVAKLAPQPTAPLQTTDVRGGGEPVILNDRAANMVLTAIAMSVTWTQQAMADTSSDALIPATMADAGAARNINLVASEAFALDSVPNAPPLRAPTPAATLDPSAEGNAQNSPVFAPTHSSAVSVRLSLIQKVADIDLPASPTTKIISTHETQGAPAISIFNPHLAVSVTVSTQASSEPVTVASNTITLSAAAQEIASILGASEQSHIINTLSLDQQALITTTNPTTFSVDAKTSSVSTQAAIVSTPSAPTEAQSSPAMQTTPNMSLVDHAILVFTTQHPDFQITKLGTEVILFDSHLTLSNVSSAVQELFTFQDGSSIYLIGLPPTATVHV